MKTTTLVLIILLVVTNGLLINRQSYIHTLQATIKTEQPIHNPDDLKRIAALMDQNKTLFSTREYAVAELAKQQVLLAKKEMATPPPSMVPVAGGPSPMLYIAMISEWNNALPYLKRYHEEHPEQPMMIDLIPWRP